MAERVLARAFGGEPLERAVWEAAGRAVYLAHPDRLDDVRAGRSGAVGFPRGDVFCFDADLYGRLRRQWDSEARTSPELWSEGVPYAGS